MKKSRKLAAETVAVAVAKENLELAMKLWHLLEQAILENAHLNSVINEAVSYCESKKKQRKRNVAWLKDIESGA